MDATVVVLSKVPGALPVKTRLHAALGVQAAEALCVQMLAATMELARSVDPQPVLAYSPPEADLRALLHELGPCRPLALAATGGGACLAEALERAARGQPLIALGGDAPDLPRALLLAALQAVAHCDLALVPTPDGGFSCLALTRPVARLEELFTFGADDARRSLLAAAAARGLSATVLAPWPDVDTPEAVAALFARGWRPRIRARGERSEPTPRSSPPTTAPPAAPLR